MVEQTCTKNVWPKDIVSLAIQVTFVYTFLTVFFFVYVQKVEEEEFVSQMNLIMDTLINDVKSDVPNIINSSSPINEEDIVVLVDGIIGLLESKIAIDATGSTKQVYEQNQNVKKIAFKSLIKFIAVVVVFASIILLLGYCVPIKYQLKKALTVVIFVGLTELMFLQVIAKNYITADPNKVKRDLSTAVQNWIKKNK
jgi:hypothetical protein